MRPGTRRTARIVVGLLAVLVAAGLLGIIGYVWACGTERWSVKTGSDPDAPFIDVSNPVLATVSDMNRWERPPVVPRYSRADSPGGGTFLMTII